MRAWIVCLKALMSVSIFAGTTVAAVVRMSLLTKRRS